MRKTVGILACIAALALVAGLVTADEEQVWFDIENCAFCKHMGTEEGMLDNIDWETHIVDNGAVTLTHVPAKYEEA